VRAIVWSSVCGVVLSVAGCGSHSYNETAEPAQPTRSATLSPRTVDPGHLRWRDVLGGEYGEPFCASFSYRGQVSVEWLTTADTLTGTLRVVGGKPNFAYQMKLVGREPVTTAKAPKSAASNPEAWASWQLGHAGRWWCENCGWNVADAALEEHIQAGHTVYGYLLFDYILTDALGSATKSFALDSTYHVLWRDDQREPTGADSPVRSQQVLRGSWGYGVEGEPLDAGRAGVFAEGEPDRPASGTVRLPAGDYSVWLNITEESFHDNLGPEVPKGGFWAQVLETNLAFTVTPGEAVIADARPGLLDRLGSLLRRG